MAGLLSSRFSAVADDSRRGRYVSVNGPVWTSVHPSGAICRYGHLYQVPHRLQAELAPESRGAGDKNLKHSKFLTENPCVGYLMLGTFGK